MDRKPLVSVVIPTYNYGQFLPEIIESVLAQTYPNIEIIVVDDGSTDNTKEIIKKYPTVRYIYQKHAGVASAMNRGVRASKGEYFTCVGADDKLHPRYIELTMKEIVKDDKIGFVYTGTQCFGESNEIGFPRKFHHRFSILRMSGIWSLGASLTRRIAFDDVGGYDERFPMSEDWDLYIRMCLKGWKGRAVFEPLYYVRVHRGYRSPSKIKYSQQLLYHKFWFMPLYIFLSRVFDALVMLLTHPRTMLVRIWNKKISRFFNYYRLIEPPGNAQHMMINESKILSLLKGKYILDCGCGIGRWGFLIRKKKIVSLWDLISTRVI